MDKLKNRDIYFQEEEEYDDNYCNYPEKLYK